MQYPIPRTSAFRILMVLSVAAVAVAGTAQAQIAPAPPAKLTLDQPDPSQRFEDIKIEQHLDAQAPLELTFMNEKNEPVSLAELLDNKPAILSLVYYHCPMLCDVVLDGVEGVVDAMKYRVGEDYNVITVSIDPKETPEMASEKKAEHLARLHRDGAGKGWHFLTGDEVAIDRLAETVGFRYVYDAASDQFAHAAGIMLLTPKGKIARYYYGVEYIPRDVEFGLQEASQGQIGNLVDQLVLLCFQYDPSTGQYGFYVIGAMRIGAVLMILGFATMYAVLYFRSRRKKRAAAGADSNDGEPPHSGAIGSESTHNA